MLFSFFVRECSDKELFSLLRSKRFIVNTSLRNITRAPTKRMLVFFKFDENTSVLGTNKVKKVLANGNKLEEGAVVLVEYDKVDYEAHVIKMHGKKKT